MKNKIYLDTSVVNILLFEKDTSKRHFKETKLLFEKIYSGETKAAISLYVLIEIYTYCQGYFSKEKVSEVFRESVSYLFSFPLEILPLVTRSERLILGRKFILKDKSDQSHAISAYLSNCRTIITYDRHFLEVKGLIKVYAPEEFLFTKNSTKKSKKRGKHQ